MKEELGGGEGELYRRLTGKRVVACRDTAASAVLPVDKANSTNSEGYARISRRSRD